MTRWGHRRQGIAGPSTTSTSGSAVHERDLRRPGDVGATVVEFAMVAPLILLLILGVVEYSLLFRDWLTVSNASREGVRVGAALGDDLNADCEIIEAVVAGLVGSDVGDVQDIRIYEADTAGNPIGAHTEIWTHVGGDPAVCTNWGSVGSWPPSARDVTVTDGEQLDIIGVRVRFTHQWVTNFGPFSGATSIDEATISRLEPQAFD